MELKEWSLDYVHDLVHHANNQIISRNLGNNFPYPYTEEDAVRFIEFCQTQDLQKTCNLAIVIDGQAVGGIGITVGSDIYEKSAELGYWLGEDYWGKGIMTKAVKQMVQLSFQNRNIIRLYATVFSHNLGSCRLLEKNGFELEGVLKKAVYKNGHLYDSKLYALLRE